MRSKMKTNTFIFASLFLAGSVAARPHNHNHASRVEKRAYVTDTIVVKVPEVINWVDNTGSTITIETKGDIKTFTRVHPTPNNGDIGTIATPNTPTMATPTVTNIPTSPFTSVSKPTPTTEMKIPELKPTETNPTGPKATIIKPTQPVITEPKMTDKLTGVKPVEPTMTEPKTTEAKPHEPTITGPETTAKLTEIKSTGPTTTRVSPTEAGPTDSKTTSAQTLTPSKSSNVPKTPHKPPAPTVSPPKNPAEEGKPGNGFGICYAPYTAAGKCKTQDQVNVDFAKLNEYGIVRSYGIDCNQIAMMLSAAKIYNKKVMLGLFTIQNIDSELNIFLAAAKNNWSYIYAVAIGNEVVNTGKSSADALANAVNHSRAVLRSNGYNGPVVAVDTVNAMVAHPEICHASDFCAVNIHPFFDPHTSAAEAGQFVREQSKAVSNAVHGAKRVIVTETGWPHGGYGNGEALPSRENQRIAIESLKQAYKDTNGELMLFSAFDDPWKVDGPNTFGAEKYWGMQ
ncbi:hypothetical protein MGYG_00395 [Nannizzia gypsea CBS 118893]|uniref:Uncharacterized protein n=1 Tax=Arthroderma gypseum (strain ATCC MYA-4604 / CBS 118893) TaxID=535722 RepID=E5QZJ0_ARTGP|nr:hypothetical protein MGYG_00395 [Nannizzia gypsea CBS 118893]EFQ97356.1 hypothetical protein MGYG_00395 [Nannizzia gypsea CBS 118893]